MSYKFCSNIIIIVCVPKKRVRVIGCERELYGYEKDRMRDGEGTLG